MSDDLLDRVQRRLLDNPIDDPAALARLIRDEAGVISDLELLDVLRRLRDNVTGAGPLERLLLLDGLTDVIVNSPQEVWIDRGHGLELTEVRFAEDDDVRRLATRLASACGRRLDDAQPFVDGRIRRDDGTLVRLHAVLSPPARSHTLLSLRVLRQATTRLEDLVRSASVPAEIAELLQSMIAARLSFLVVGGTGTGKTTLLSALLAEVPAHERIICIEDTAELDPVHPHVVGLTTRAHNTEGTGAISMSDLLVQALRMRPDRLVVGEIRGREVVDLLAALNTGHDGGAGTLHANTAAEIPARMEALAALGGLDRAALHSQLAAAVDIALVMRRRQDGTRELAQIAVLEGNPVQVRTLWRSGEPASARLREQLTGKEW
ncbi:TadA family conjugal transfer-associated ATPase [Corynebacterium tapiri]|uniref:TadA family conjugal transfer-associated ATPase n=2 Tax=Corynebacterium tapiri TaxID=1448266 RepID=A0A5C4U3D1_9CORY|nr:TadA family conjugal transfer-associated ATPase [Corynebacterium tapiri]TNL97417.1 TadA family conjugal transfer-associated ATPase [Corynebacterium tapiri]